MIKPLQSTNQTQKQSTFTNIIVHKPSGQLEKNVIFNGTIYKLEFWGMIDNSVVLVYSEIPYVCDSNTQLSLGLYHYLPLLYKKN